LPVLEKASAGAPAAAQIRYHLAVALNDAGQPGKAKQELQTVVKAQPPIEEAAKARALLKQLSGD
jgi:Tfp pilus assembly protein PilF